jgi:hypothetical protein
MLTPEQVRLLKVGDIVEQVVGNSLNMKYREVVEDMKWEELKEKGMMERAVNHEIVFISIVRKQPFNFKLILN